MQNAQQIVGVNKRLGNSAVPNMQGTTRYLYDSQDQIASTNQTLTFFQNVSQRPFPLSNFSNNRFEVGESLAIQGITYFWRETTVTTLAAQLQTSAEIATDRYTNTFILDFYIGNQRVIKSLDLNYSRVGIGEAHEPGVISNVLRFETPIVIPPQIEFYATIRITSNINVDAKKMYLGIYGQGTLLNTKSNF